MNPAVTKAEVFEAGGVGLAGRVIKQITTSGAGARIREIAARIAADWPKAGRYEPPHFGQLRAEANRLLARALGLREGRVFTAGELREGHRRRDYQPSEFFDLEADHPTFLYRDRLPAAVLAHSYQLPEKTLAWAARLGLEAISLESVGPSWHLPGSTRAWLFVKGGAR